MFCRQQAVQLHRDRHRFEQAGARLVLIGHGRREQAADFQRGYQLEEVLLLVDSERQVYQALGTAKAGLGGLFGPQVIAAGIRSVATDRVIQGKVAGDARQLGGVFVIATDGSIAFSHPAADASDHPATERVLEAVAACR